jgi:GNAT superfamily N-acetyltransferase
MNFTIQQATPADFPSIIELIRDTFYTFIAPNYSEEGKQTFETYIQLDRLLNRQHNHQVYIALSSMKSLLGIIEIRENSHISLFFTSRHHLGEGIGTALFQLAKKICLSHNPQLSEITVFSSPFAIDIYKKLGFIATSETTIKNGMEFTPMSFLFK